MKTVHAVTAVVAGLCALNGSDCMVSAAEAAKPAETPFPLVERFEHWGVPDGLPAWKIHCVLPSIEDQVWIGTAKGLVLREGGKFKVIGPEQGLSHSIVLCLTEDLKSGDLWIGTMKGLNRYSGGRITSYTQLNSGLPNNVVYGLAVANDTVWVATAAGLGALNLRDGTWRLFDHTNTVMHEPWVYAVAPANDRLYVAVWGGGIVEHDFARGSFKEHVDPDKDFHFDLVPDDGPINDVSSWCSWEDGVLWQATYFGLARYDGNRWKTWVEGKTPLSSNFINIVIARGRVAWIGTDRGLSVTDGVVWANYRRGEPGKGVLEIARPESQTEVRATATALPDDFILGLAFGEDDDIWFATSHGLGRGLLAPAKALTEVTRNP